MFARFVRTTNKDITDGRTGFLFNEFVVKLNNTSGSHYGSYVKFCIGVEGVLDKITEYKNNVNVFTYYSTVVIAARIPHNTQASVVCFGGVAKVRNPNKKGTDRTSPFSRCKDKVISNFAELAIQELKRVCPFSMTDQVLRVDFHGIRHQGTLKFLVNAIEGFETWVLGSGKGSDIKLSKLEKLREIHWIDTIDTLIECYLELNK